MLTFAILHACLYVTATRMKYACTVACTSVFLATGRQVTNLHLILFILLAFDARLYQLCLFRLDVSLCLMTPHG